MASSSFCSGGTVQFAYSVPIMPVCTLYMYVLKRKGGIWKHSQHQSETLLVIQKLPEKNLSWFHVMMAATAAK